MSKLAIPDLVGKPLEPVPEAKGMLPVGWPMLPDGSCGANDTASWAEHAGQTDYNIKNKCCRQLNGGAWGQLSYSSSAQNTMRYLLDQEGDGPGYYAKYVKLLTQAVAQYPAAVGIETMNEPPVADVSVDGGTQTGALFKLYERIYETVEIITVCMDSNPWPPHYTRGLSEHP
eukprot:SAG31_NODE_16_length_36206_cov_27.355728_13_plen_173_part_00